MDLQKQYDKFIKDEISFSNKFKIEYINKAQFSKIKNILYEMRILKIITSDNYHLFNSLMAKYYRNSIELKNKVESEPRKKAQIFIGNKDVRQFIFSRDKVCLCCGTSDKLSIDHIIAVNKGGENIIDNLQTLCKSCNSRKGVKHIDYRK